MMRTLQFATIGAFSIRIRRQSIVCTAHIPLRFRYFILWNSHNRAISTVGDTYWEAIDILSWPAEQHVLLQPLRLWLQIGQNFEGIGPFRGFRRLFFGHQTCSWPQFDRCQVNIRVTRIRIKRQ
jgi:hypothetical protein